MTDAKHTPGPWRLNKNYQIGIPHGDKEAGEAAWIDLEDAAGHFAPENLEANARLIASAPELLEALRAQVNWRMRDGSPCACPAGRDEDEPRGTMPTLHATNCDYLRAAILKAEGVQS